MCCVGVTPLLHPVPLYCRLSSEEVQHAECKASLLASGASCERLQADLETTQQELGSTRDRWLRSAAVLEWLSVSLLVRQ